MVFDRPEEHWLPTQGAFGLSEFAIDEKVTCLVGKNESGKTAILQALEKLNPVDVDDGKFEQLDYAATAG